MYYIEYMRLKRLPKSCTHLHSWGMRILRKRKENEHLVQYHCSIATAVASWLKPCQKDRREKRKERKHENTYRNMVHIFIWSEYHNDRSTESCQGSTRIQVCMGQVQCNISWSTQQFLCTQNIDNPDQLMIVVMSREETLFSQYYTPMHAVQQKSYIYKPNKKCLVFVIKK